MKNQYWLLGPLKRANTWAAHRCCSLTLFKGWILPTPFLVYGRALIQFKSAHHTKPVHLKIKPVLSMCCAPYEFYHSPPASALTRTNPVYSCWQSPYLLLCQPGESSQPKPIRKLLKISIGRPCPSNVSSCMKSPTPAPWSIYFLCDFFPYNPVLLLICSPCPFQWDIKCIMSNQSTI